MSAVAIKRFEKRELGEYYAGPGLWVEDANEARKFKSLMEASRLVGTPDVPRGSCVVVIAVCCEDVVKHEI